MYIALDVGSLDFVYVHVPDKYGNAIDWELVKTWRAKFRKVAIPFQCAEMHCLGWLELVEWQHVQRTGNIEK